MVVAASQATLSLALCPCFFEISFSAVIMAHALCIVPLVPPVNPRDGHNEGNAFTAAAHRPVRVYNGMQIIMYLRYPLVS